MGRHFMGLAISLKTDCLFEQNRCICMFTFSRNWCIEKYMRAWYIDVEVLIYQ